MKITDVRLRTFDCPHPDHVFHPTWQPMASRSHRVSVVEVHTDEGITGIGSGGVLTRLNTTAGLFVGRDPLAIEQHVEMLTTVAYFMARPWPIEIALWDIAGKAAGLPLYKLLGGKRDRLPAYASTGELRPKSQRVDDVLAIREAGFRATKLRFHSPDPTKDDLPTLEAVREAVGDSLTIMVDGNQGWRYPADLTPRWDFKTALKLVQAMEDHDVFWLEEPLWSYDYDGLAQLRSSTTVRIAGGELNLGLHEFREYLRHGCLDVYQPDCTFAGGITTARAVAGMALAEGLLFAPHTWSNGIGLMANLHLAAAMPNCPFIEFPHDPPNWTPAVRDFMLTEPINIDDDGNVRISERPGLGVELDEEKCSKYEVK
jgi:L-alanine-DL-glutamate epimerase-like enolase superfamily enzyme